MILWHLGNTTVRTPYRLRDALRVLQGSPLNGNISGPEQENEFAVLLHRKGIVNSPRVKGGKDASDLGCKWRSALSQLGFITPKLTRQIKSGSTDPALHALIKDIRELSGRPYEITPNGHRLANSKVITAQQECFLRAFTSYKIPSVLEKRYKTDMFSPLRYILQIMHSLETHGQEGSISFREFALFVQTSTPADSLENTIQKIIEYREGKYDQYTFEQALKDTGEKHGTVAKDYPDVSFRYLKATGIFCRVRSSIALAPSRAQLAALLRDEPEQKLSDIQYLQSLLRGAELPTDNPSSHIRW